MRLVRREDARGVCLVLLRFCDAETAAGFYENYNGRPVRLQALRTCLAQRSCSYALHGPTGKSAARVPGRQTSANQ